MIDSGGKMKVKWLFFDIGSTLIDEAGVYERRIGRIAELAGISKESASEKVLELYKQNKKGDLELARKYDVELPKWESEYEVPYREAEDVLKKLHDKYKIGIIANQNPGTRERLEAWGLLKYIDMVVASAEEGAAKPDRRIFDIALERAGVAPEDTFMIGDRIDNDILPAKNIGMKTIWVQQGFGGLWVIKNDSELPNFIAYNLSDVVSILDSFENSKSLLETTLNTRDLGDYKTRDGIELQKDKFIRSDRQAYPSEKDLEYLKNHKITTIIDMRTPDDCLDKPSAFLKLGDFSYYNYPIQEGSQVPESVEAVPESYMKIASSPALKDIFNKMAEVETGVMYNCAAGKDRTGVVTAIILMLCDVKEEDIIYDYMLTKEYNKERFKMAAIHHPDLDINIIIPRESYIRDFMRLFIKKYGSVEGYFESIGVSKENVERIKKKLSV